MELLFQYPILDVYWKSIKILEKEKIEFLVKPQKRYEGKAGEQLTMFVFDFSGNPLEFKAFTNSNEVFSIL